MNKQVQTTKSIIVKGDVSKIYQIWADFESFPKFMQHIKGVTKTGERTSHWVMEGPMNAIIEWDAETTRLEENTRVAWNSKDGSELKTSGQVTFTPLPQNQTEVTVTLQYAIPDTLASKVVAHLFGDPDRYLQEDLRRFKAYAEGREVTSAEGA